MKKSNSRIEVFKVKGGIDSIPRLMEFDNVEEISKFAHIDVEDAKKTFHHRWEQSDGNCIEELIIDDNVFRTFKVNASVQSNTVPFSKVAVSRDFLRNDQLWKKTHHCPVEFAEENGDTYMFINGNRTSNDIIKSKLLRLRKPDTLWQDVEENIIKYTFEENFFLWVLINSENTIELPNGEEIEIVDILDLDSYNEFKERTYTNNGSNSFKDNITYTLIADPDIEFSNMGIYCNYKDLRLVFKLSKDGIIEYSNSNCGDYSDVSRKPITDTRILITIYLDLLPQLQSSYREFCNENGSTDYFDNIRKEYKKLLESNL